MQGFSGHGRIEVSDRVDGLHWRVGAGCDDYPCVEQVSPNVGTLFDAQLAETANGPGPVGAEMDRLHRSNHALLGKKRAVSQSQMLGVLNTKAVVTALCGKRCKHSKHLRIGTVADGVDVDLPITLSRVSNKR